MNKTVKSISLKNLKPFNSRLKLENWEKIFNIWLEEPRRLDMRLFLNATESSPYNKIALGDLDAKDAPPCGTVGCLAGWSAALVGNRSDEIYDFLGITYDEAKNRVYYVYVWPDKYSLRYTRIEDMIEKRTSNRQFIKLKEKLVRVTIGRFRYFLRTGK